jgi:hypothetical protein
MGLFEKKESTESRELPTISPEPSVPLPAAHSVVTNTVKDPLEERTDRKESSAKDWADSKGYFSTDLIADVRSLTAKGHQPTHVEGAKMDRPHKLFVYALSPDEARSLLNG